MKLYFIETAKQIDWFIKHLQYEDEKTQLLAITPEASYACQKFSLPYIKFEDYVRFEIFFQMYDNALLDYLEWERWLDSWLQSQIPEFYKANFQPAKASSIYLQLLHAEIWSVCMGLKELLDKLNPTVCYYWPPQIIDIPDFLHPVTSTLPLLLPIVAESVRLEIIDLSKKYPLYQPVVEHQKQAKKFSRIWRIVKINLSQSQLMADIKKHGWLGLRSHIRFYQRSRNEYLLGGYGYDIQSLGLELRLQGANIHVFNPYHSVRNSNKLTCVCEALYQELLSQSEFWQLLDKYDIGNTSLWELPLKHWFCQLIPQYWQMYQRFAQQFEIHDWKAVIMPDVNSSYGLVANAANNRNIPVCLYQHGSSSGVDHRIWQSWLRNTNALLTYGKGTQEELSLDESSKFLTLLVADTIPVGSTRLDRLKKPPTQNYQARLRNRLQSNKNKPVVLYIPHTFGGYGRAISYLLDYPDVSYFELQQTIISLWQDEKVSQLAYKEFMLDTAYPYPTVSDWIRVSVPNVIVTNQKLTDLMWSVDAIIIDHVVTAIGEVLLTSKPILAYMPQTHYRDSKAITLLHKRATVSETPSEFVQDVQNFLRNGDYSEIENPNTEYLEHYCTHLNDGNSAKRAASYLLKTFK